MPFRGLLLVSLALAPMALGAEPSPIVLEKLKHEEALFHWHPPFTRNVPAFDHRGRPYIRSRAESLDATGSVHTLRDGQWVKLDFLEAVPRQPGLSARHQRRPRRPLPLPEEQQAQRRL